jgi:protein O-GlcNAc transferase
MGPVATAYSLSGNLEEAVRVLEIAAEATPADSRVHTRLGDLYMRTGALEKAVERFRRALQQFPADGNLWANLGHCLSRLGKEKEALWAFEKAVQLDPNDPVFLYDLGDAYLAVEEPKKALGPLLKAIQRRPDYPLAHYDLGLAFFKLGKYAEGAAASRAALSEDTEIRFAESNLGLNAMTNLGLCLSNLGQLEEALSCFQRIVEMFAPTYFNIGLAQFRLHRYEEALASFKKALEITPNDAEYLDLLGNAYSELGQLTEAQAALKCAIDADPKYALAHYDLGTVLAQIEAQQHQALRCFERAIELDSDLFWAYYSVGCIHAKEGRKDLALQSIEKALEKGMRDFDHIAKDADLESIRQDSSFQGLLQRYRKA